MSYLDEVNKCLTCVKPSCELGCPLHNHIKDFIKAIKEDDYVLARNIIEKENPFPLICSSVCAYEKQCEGNCIKNKIKDAEAVKVFEIEKAVSLNYEPDIEIKDKNGLNVAIVGSGIGALSAAKLLLCAGFEVDIFEKEDFIGGTILSGIPSYRLNRKFVNKAIDLVKSLGAKFYLNQYIDNEKLLKLKEKYDYVIIAVGAMNSNKMRVQGEEEYSEDGLKLLYDLNINKSFDEYKKYKNVAVIGGGNVAMDCARSLKRICENVTIIYRRTIKQMPATKYEIKEAIHEGVMFMELNNPIEFKDGSLVLQEMELGELDESGRASFIAKEGAIKEMAFDFVVRAIGQKVDNTVFEMDYTPWATFDVKGHKTSVDKVYALGDAVLGPKTVAHVIEDAKECVKEILEVTNV